ncbi:expressed unknown protein [Seminavis robusta]|uniref:Uncharacterized protein n=1 Tax=Seminavis robusta TaxID=568900 RepID=A0A9N8DI28_9STRA|nr:expressed unknown protein [Seminavis robusta]|eukprot:Sro75_g041310.1 n/a (320) ;mRNA; f:81014-81973
MDDLLQVQSIHDLRKFSRGKQEASDLNNLWEKTVLLIRASQEDGMNKPLEEINILGTLIEKRMSNLCIWMALRLLPSSCLSHRDSQGRMPLHLAVLSHKQDYYWHNWSGLPACTRAVMDESTVFDMLISAYPDSATEPDSNGSLPLPLLLRECNRSFAGLTTKGKEFMMRSVQAVAKHAPQVLTLPNRDDNMLPFMLAARSSLDLTFAILIEHPSVLACGTKKATDREIWLTRKFSKAQTQIQKLEDENRQLRALLAQQKQQEPAPPLPPRVAPIKIYNLPSLQFPTPKRRNDMVAASDEDAQVCSDRPSKARRLEPGY